MPYLTISDLSNPTATAELVRDVCHRHPGWVHEQLGTASESELQLTLDQCSLSDYARNPGTPDACGIYMATDAVALWIESLNEAGLISWAGDLRGLARDADTSYTARWIESSEQREWDFPCHLKVFGSRAVLWSLTDEAGVADQKVIYVEEGADLDELIRDFAEDIASSLGRLVTDDDDGVDEDALIVAAGGDPDCDHEWTSEGESGCEENPGVWGIGGAAILIRRHCVHCGLIREEITGDTNVPSRDGVTYRMP